MQPARTIRARRPESAILGPRCDAAHGTVPKEHEVASAERPEPRGRDVNALLATLHRVERTIVIIAFSGMVGVVFADVLAREVTGIGLPWARQVGVYFNIVVVMFGIGLASASGSHLRPRFADGWLPARWEIQLAFLQHALFALFCVAFAIIATDMVITSVRLDQRSEILRLPVWPIQAVIPLVFGVTALRHGIYAVRPELRPTPPATGADDS